METTAADAKEPPDDIDERVERMRQRLSSEERARLELHGAIIEALPDAMIVVNDVGEIVTVNAAAEFMFGYHRSELMGLPVHVLLLESGRAAHVGHCARFMEDSRRRPMGSGLTVRGLRKNATEIALDIMLAPAITPSGSYVIAVIRRRS